MAGSLTIHEAAETTGWSPRMLRYLERVGLVEPSRTDSGYRVFGPGELQRLRTLRELLARFDCGLSDVAFAKRMRDDQELRDDVAGWLLANFLSRTILIAAVNARLPEARLLARAAHWAIVLFTVATALTHLGIGKEMVLVAFGVLAGVASGRCGTATQCQV